MTKQFEDKVKKWLKQAPEESPELWLAYKVREDTFRECLIECKKGRLN